MKTNPNNNLFDLLHVRNVYTYVLYKMWEWKQKKKICGNFPYIRLN